MLSAVLFDVDFTIARPGPELGPDGYRRLGARLFEGSQVFLEAEIARGDHAAGDRNATDFLVNLSEDGDTHGCIP